MTRLVVVDDHPMVITGIETALADSPIEVVGSASSAADAVSVVSETTPDVVIMDIGLPDSSGIAAMRQIRDAELEPSPAILAFTMSEEPVTVLAALRAGCAGYVVKGIDADGLIRAIQAVAGGAVYLGPQIADAVIGSATSVEGAPTGRFNLSQRETEVLDLMANGLGNQVIAARLHLAAKTVRNLVSSVIGKLGVSSRAEAIVLGRQMGLGSPE